MGKTEPPKTLQHFTSLKRLFQILEGECLFLGDTGKWKDKNDTALIRRYREETGAQNVLAMCFNQGAENIHHWEHYGKDGGCRITFSGEGLAAALHKRRDIIHGPMEYVQVRDLNKLPRPLPVDRLPFYKRWPYHIEGEYRLVYAGDRGGNRLPISLDIIRDISLEGSIDEAGRKRLTKRIQKLAGKDIKISQNTIAHNKQWVGHFEKTPVKKTALKARKGTNKAKGAKK